MSTGEIHDLYDSILILDFGSQVRSAARAVSTQNHSLTRIVLALDHSTMS